MNNFLASIVQVLRLAFMVAAIAVLASFGLFVIDELDEGSKVSQADIADEAPELRDRSLAIPDPPRNIETLREQENDDIREVIDDANDALVSPFSGLTDTGDNIWQQRLITSGLGLLLYGGIMLLLANYLPKRRARPTSSVYDIPPDYRKR